MRLVICGSGMVVVRDSARTCEATNAPTVEADIASHNWMYWQGSASGRVAGIVWGRWCFAGQCGHRGRSGRPALRPATGNCTASNDD